MRKTKLRFFSMFLSVFLITLSVINPVQVASAHKSYYMATIIDPSGFRYVSTITEEDKKHQSETYGYAPMLRNWEDVIIPDVTGNSAMSDSGDIDDMDSVMEKRKSSWYSAASIVEGSTDNKVSAFVFPAVHNAGLIVKEINGDAEDYDRASFLGNALTSSLNDAIYFVLNTSGFNTTDFQNFQYTKAETLLSLGKSLSDSARSAVRSSGGTFTFNSVKFKVEKVTSDSGTDSKYINPQIPLTTNGRNGESYNYIKISAPNGKYVIVPYKAPKGYWKGSNSDNVRQEQVLAGKVPSSVARISNKEDTPEMSWSHIVFQAGWLYDVEGISASSLEQIAKPNPIEQVIADMIANAVKLLETMLGMFTLPELMLNKGSRASSYVLGMMPQSWYTSSILLFVVSQFIAWFLIIGSLVKLLAQRSVASINPSVRINLLNGLKNIIIAVFGMTFSISAILLMARFNINMVDVFAKSTVVSSTFGTVGMSSPGLIAGALIQLAFFIVTAYFNFIYIMRAVSLVILIGTSPLFIVSIAFGEKYSSIFSTWCKELTSNLFLQTFHAIMVSAFANVLTDGGSRGIETLVVFYAFIPLSAWFRSAIVGINGATAGEGVAGGLLSTVSGVATGAATATMMRSLREGYSNKKGGKSSGGGSYADDLEESLDSVPLGNGSMNTGASKEFKGAVPSFASAETMRDGEIPDVVTGETGGFSQEQLRAGSPVASATGFSGGLSGSMKSGAAGIAKEALKVGALGAFGAGSLAMASAGSPQAARALGTIGSHAMSGGVSRIKESIGDFKSGSAGSIEGISSSGLGSYGQINAEFNPTSGVTSTTFDNEGLRQSTGISNIRTSGGTAYCSYDLNDDGEIAPAFANSKFEATRKDIMNQFTLPEGERNEDAISHYESFGVKGAGYDRDNKPVIMFDQSKLGLDSVTYKPKSGKTIIEQSNIISDASGKFVSPAQSFVDIPKFGD